MRGEKWKDFLWWIEGEGLVMEMWLWRGIKNMRYY